MPGTSGTPRRTTIRGGLGLLSRKRPLGALRRSLHKRLAPKGPTGSGGRCCRRRKRGGFRAIIKEEQRVASRALNLATMRSKAADMHSNEGGTRKNKKRSRRHKKRRGKKTRRHKSKRYKH